MNARAVGFVSFALCATPAALAQEAEQLATIDARVTAVRPGAVSIDRGTIDGLARGDVVVFRPPQGGTSEGTIVTLDERSAVVRLHRMDFVPAAGMRAEIQIPRARLAPAVVAPQEQPAPLDLPEHPPWEKNDEAWRQGMPLLAQVKALQPAERTSHISGRFYAIADQTVMSQGDRSSSLYRFGAGALYENPFGNGGDVHVDVEQNFRRTDVPDDDDVDSSRLRIDRVSYSWGGTRFADDRVEIGRFLQREMPEFGVIDGVDWGRRVSNGCRFGASLGWMPEPDQDYESGDDFEAAAWARWVADESEQLSAAAGYQKTFHHSNADRDLIVAKVAYVPPERWTFNGTLWLDLYTAGDDAKGSGAEVTQALVFTGRRFDNGSSVFLSYSHQAFPEIDRFEFTPVTEEQLADDHNDRIALDGVQPIGAKQRVHFGLGGWIDEDDDGGDAQVGIGFDDLLFERSLIDVSVFSSLGSFSTAIGGRLGIAAYTQSGAWRLDYELAQHKFDGFSSDNDDLPEHRLRASRDVHSASGWSFSAYVDGVLLDDENSIAIGLHLQKSF